jgi:hypothetical protein
MIFLFDNDCNVVNLKKDRYDVYIGRGSPYGNPFVIGTDGTRDEVIDKYKIYFYDKIANDPRFKQQVSRLKSKILGCHCKPLRCHGDIIKQYIEAL